MALLDAPLLLLFFGGSSLVGLAMLWYGGRDLLLAYRILTTDPTDAASLADGAPVEVEGVARPQDGTTTAPFTGTECLAFEYEVKEEEHTQHGQHWRTIDSGRYHVPFRVEDDTASVLVDPQGAEFRFSAERSINVHGGDRPPERIVSFIESNEDVDSEDRTLDLKLFELKTGSDRKYIERRLDPGEPIHVLGEARYDTSAGRRGGEVNVVIERGESVPRFLISDTDERGAAWRVAWSGLPYVLAGLLLLTIAGLLFVGSL
ncbi:GIDE domain-containing protein [Haladaptatus sp. NG-SE-30]